MQRNGCLDCATRNKLRLYVPLRKTVCLKSLVIVLSNRLYCNQKDSCQNLQGPYARGKVFTLNRFLHLQFKSWPLDGTYILFLDLCHLVAKINNFGWDHLYGMMTCTQFRFKYYLGRTVFLGIRLRDIFLLCQFEKSAIVTAHKLLTHSTLQFRLEEDSSRSGNKNQNNALTALARKGSKYESSRSSGDHTSSPSIPGKTFDVGFVS